MQILRSYACNNRITVTFPIVTRKCNDFGKQYGHEKQEGITCFVSFHGPEIQHNIQCKSVSIDFVRQFISGIISSVIHTLI